MKLRKLVYFCDWLPPDFGAVGQYSVLFAQDWTARSYDVVLAGLSSTVDSNVRVDTPDGSLEIIRLKAEKYDKGSLRERALWTLRVNTKLITRLWRHLREADDILFTGSPPFLIHFLVPLNVLLRKRMIYRITDFHPECLMAERGGGGLMLKVLYRVTVFWRRRIHHFEALGEDQRERLKDIGIPETRIEIKRDPSPVEITSRTLPMARPEGYDRAVLLLYSGNWGVAHDTQTFIEAYRQHHRRGSGRVVLWLNAVGAGARTVEEALQADGLPYVRGKPVPLDELANLLVTPDAHLITLKDDFVGFVLPSKVYGCLASGKPLIYVGSRTSDVHLLASEAEALGVFYRNCPVAAVEELLASLEELAGNRRATPMDVEPGRD